MVTLVVPAESSAPSQPRSDECGVVEPSRHRQVGLWPLTSPHRSRGAAMCNHVSLGDCAPAASMDQATGHAGCRTTPRYCAASSRTDASVIPVARSPASRDRDRDIARQPPGKFSAVPVRGHRQLTRAVNLLRLDLFFVNDHSRAFPGVRRLTDQFDGRRVIDPLDAVQDCRGPVQDHAADAQSHAAIMVTTNVQRRPVVDTRRRVHHGCSGARNWPRSNRRGSPSTLRSSSNDDRVADSIAPPSPLPGLWMSGGSGRVPRLLRTRVVARAAGSIGRYNA